VVDIYLRFRKVNAPTMEKMGMVANGEDALGMNAAIRAVRIFSSMSLQVMGVER